MRCASYSAPGSAASGAQALINNVADFQVRYLVQASGGGDPTMRFVKAENVINWGAVQAVEVCLVLYGNEPINLPDGSTYAGCTPDDEDGSYDVPMSTLTGAQKNRMHLAFRNLFQLRSQGLIG